MTKKLTEKTRNLYNRFAHLYQWLFMDLLHFDEALESFLGNIEFQNNLKVLDAGCGAGTFLIALMKATEKKEIGGMRYHGFDLTPKMLKIFQDKIDQDEIGEVLLAEADVLDLSKLPDSWKNFDLIISSGMLEYLSKQDIVVALKNLVGLLDDNGRMIIFVTKDTSFTRLLIKILWGANVYEKAEFAEILKRSGFTKVDFHEFPDGFTLLSKGGFLVEASI